MQVKDAVKAAKQYVSDVFEDEGLTNLGLEEVEYVEPKAEWEITLGFSRPWNIIRGPLSTITGENSARRSYRVVRVRDSDGVVTSIKSREMAD